MANRLWRRFNQPMVPSYKQTYIPVEKEMVNDEVPVKQPEVQQEEEQPEVVVQKEIIRIPVETEQAQKDAKKLSDLALLWQEYTLYLEEDGIDGANQEFKNQHYCPQFNEISKILSENS